jgi:hypothetical protein
MPQDRLDDLGFGLLMTSYALLLAFCFVNLGPVRGMGIVTIGVAMNMLVIGLNQGMPTTDKVWRDGSVVEEPFEETVKHQPETDSDLVPFLGDTIPLPPPLGETISFGDIVLAFGVLDVCYWASRKRRRRLGDGFDEPIDEAIVTAVIVDEPEIDLTVEPDLEPGFEPEPSHGMAGSERSGDDYWPVKVEGPERISWSAGANGNGVEVDTAEVDITPARESVDENVHH